MNPLRVDMGALLAQRQNQAGFLELDALRQPWVQRWHEHAGRKIPGVGSSLRLGDRLGMVRMRLDWGRSLYRVLPGLYALGEPDRQSPVLVTANYKYTFDVLRRAMAGHSVWIVVLDTKGVNVWCAAGKGTFGTEECIQRVLGLGLDQIVDHRELILPQLGASGVSARAVQAATGFRVLWGPVRAADLPAWFAAGKVKSPVMGRVTFTLAERMAVAGVELVHGWPVLLGALVLGALGGLSPAANWWPRALPRMAVLAAVLPLGTLAFPALLPCLPFRPFGLKGAFLGGVWALAAGLLADFGPFSLLAVLLLAVPATAFLAMNFTGSSTFTSQAGALKEVERGFWPLVISTALGLALGIAAGFLGL